ncbi:MAG: ACP phosphodiesterase [Planctomycetota bacterium]
MNFLAHLLLAERAGADPLGAVLPDLGAEARRVQGALGPAVRRSCALHRHIDAWVDAQPVAAAARRVFAIAGHYAGIAVDLAFDHHLAAHWAEFDTRPLTQFAAACYAALERPLAAAPEIPRRLGGWRRHRVLESYASQAGLEQALQRVARRARRVFPSAEIAARARRQQHALGAAFAELWPQLERQACCMQAAVELRA